MANEVFESGHDISREADIVKIASYLVCALQTTERTSSDHFLLRKTHALVHDHRLFRKIYLTGIPITT